MSHCIFAALAAVTVWLAPVLTSGQDRVQGTADAASVWAQPRTPDGDPDLQGYWTTQTFTPLEQPEHLAGKEFFTEEEVAAL